MGYQYAHEQNDSGSRKGVITKNWRRLKEISPGDRFVAFLRGGKFFATGKVITPRRPKTDHDRTDTIDEYLKRRRSHDTGYVYFTVVVYENFEDDWRDSFGSRRPVRIDVERWENLVRNGVVVNGIVNGIDPKERQKAVFEIAKGDFDRIAKELTDKHGMQADEEIPSPDGSAAEALTKTAAQVDESGYFNFASLTDERQRTFREIVERRGQPDFRNKLIVAYAGRCAVTGCDAVAALEAAHIVPYTGPKFNHVTNGLLLRADIHTLFDLDLIGLNPESLSISLAPAIKATVYAGLEEQKLLRPTKAANAPNQDVLIERWKRFCKGKETPETPGCLGRAGSKLDQH